MALKQILKSIIGPNNIAKIRKLMEKKEPLKWPVDSPAEIEKRKQFYSSFLKKGSLFFDVGANIGNRVEPVLMTGANVVAFEPQDYCRQVLKARFGNKIKVVNNGLGEKEEVKTFYISNATTISSFSTDWIKSVKEDRFKEFNWDTEVKVEMTTLDKMVAKFGRPDFIKIDVEGFELEVLKGLTQSVPYISYEYTTPEQTDKAVDCLRYIEKVSGTVKCNYSIGESMKLELDQWITPDEMEKTIRSDSFVSTGFGDIYIKSI